MSLSDALMLLFRFWSVDSNVLIPTHSVCAGPVIYASQFYRILSSAFWHMGIMHILFNMMSLYSLGGPLERALGTLCFLGLNLAIAILSNIQYVLGSWLAYKATGDLSWLVYCSVGFSGVLFGLVVQLFSADYCRRYLSIFTLHSCIPFLSGARDEIGRRAAAVIIWRVQRPCGRISLGFAHFAPNYDAWYFFHWSSYGDFDGRNVHRWSPPVVFAQTFVDSCLGDPRIVSGFHQSFLLLCQLSWRKRFQPTPLCMARLLLVVFMCLYLCFFIFH